MKRARILVVDDEPGMLRAVTRVLMGRHDVSAATSAREAIQVARQEPPDLAILDIRLPESSGFELMRMLKEEHPGVDFILMTGSVSEPDSSLVRAIREKAFYFIQKPFDRLVLETLVERCLELRRLALANRHHLRRLERELGEARAVQQGLLPPARVDLKGLLLRSLYAPCAEVGGDLYDYAESDGAVALLVADVSGHGASAALLTGVVKAAFQASHAAGFEPLAVLRRLGEGLRSFGNRRFVTAFAGRIAADRRSLEYASAGHPAALLVRPGGPTQALASTGLVVSPAFREARWERRRVSLEAGDRLVVYTDGPVETLGEEGEFGGERLQGFVEGFAGTAEELPGALGAELRRFAGGREQGDDWTVLVAEIH